MKKCMLFLMVMVLLALMPLALAGEEGAVAALGTVEEKANGADDYVVYPALENAGPFTEEINGQITEKMQLQAYQNILQFGTGSAGLQVDFEAAMGEKMVSLVVSAKGKMPFGRPSQVYYPMNFCLESGEEIPFESLFADADGAMAYMEMRLEEMEETLSTHLENRSLFPVPFERYTVDETGGITLWYEREQLSFLSGFSGSVYFRFSELEPYYDLSETGYLSSIRKTDEKIGFLSGLGSRMCIGVSLEDALLKYRSTVDSEYYPGGACYEVEDARLQGTVLIVDEGEETVLGMLTGRMDDGGIITGKTTLEEAKALLGNDYISLMMDENTAQMYRVCAGESVTYKKAISTPHGEQNAAYTLYGDANGVVQYIKLMIEQ